MLQPEPPLKPHQPAHVAVGARGRHRTGRIAGDDAAAGVPRAAVEPHQPTGGPAFAQGRHRTGRVAGDDAAAGVPRAAVEPHQPTRGPAFARGPHHSGRIAEGDAACAAVAAIVPHQSPDRPTAPAPHGTGRIARDNAALIESHQTADRPAFTGARHSQIANPHVPYLPAGADAPEQPDAARGTIDVQVGDGVHVALERGRVAPDGRPANAAVPVFVCHIHVAIPVRVEVQIPGQLVPGAVIIVGIVRRGGTAHARYGVGKGGGIDDRVCVVVHGAVAVQVPADGVQLRQGADLDQAVPIAVVGNRGCHGLGRHKQKDGPESQQTWNQSWDLVTHCWRLHY